MSARSAPPIYMDYNATTWHAPEVAAAMRPLPEDHFGNPSSSHRLPNTLIVSIFGINANELLVAVELYVSASAEAACHSGQVQSSHVLRAMVIPEEWARGTIRLSTGRNTTREDAPAVVSAVAEAAASLRRGR